MAKVVAPRGERGQSPEFDPSNRSVLVLLLQGKFVLVLLLQGEFVLVLLLQGEFVLVLQI